MLAGFIIAFTNINNTNTHNAIRIAVYVLFLKKKHKKQSRHYII